MPETSNNDLREKLLAALAANTARLHDGLRTELARSVKLQEGHALQFEVDPWSWGVSSCASEEPIITDDWLTKALTWGWFEQAETAGADDLAMIEEELCPWFAAGWEDVGGPLRYSPAYLFFHGYHLQQYDLERRRWLSAEDTFGG